MWTAGPSMSSPRSDLGVGVLRGEWQAVRCGWCQTRQNGCHRRGVQPGNQQLDAQLKHEQRAMASGRGRAVRRGRECRSLAFGQRGGVLEREPGRRVVSTPQSSGGAEYRSPHTTAMTTAQRLGVGPHACPHGRELWTVYTRHWSGVRSASGPDESLHYTYFQLGCRRSRLLRLFVVFGVGLSLCTCSLFVLGRTFFFF
jgi:hypothetical protein